MPSWLLGSEAPAYPGREARAHRRGRVFEPKNSSMIMMLMMMSMLIMLVVEIMMLVTTMVIEMVLFLLCARMGNSNLPKGIRL